jgi:GntR family transcriptional repressor for pyruvate dehydrogenase complex
VKSLTPLTTGWPAIVEVTERSFSMLELLEVRRIIESKAAGLAAARASEHDLREILAAQEALDDNSTTFQNLGELDIALHAAIFKAAKNSVLTRVHNCLPPLVIASREIAERSAPDWTQMRRDHAAIVQAVCRGESAAAEQAMTEHFHHVGLDLISNRKR